MFGIFRRRGGSTKPLAAGSRFDRFLSQRAVDATKLTPREAVDAMLEFYTVERFDRCEFQQDGDMLLFQWGDYASLDGPGSFSLDVTRQLMWSDREEDDPEIWQSSLRFVFPLGEAARAAGRSNRWCHSPSELESFRAFVTSSPAFEAFADDPSVAPRIMFESAE